MAYPLKNLPQSERPRERLLNSGEEALSTHELLAILLGSGTQGKSVLHLSQELLSHFGTLSSLLEASIEELKMIKGIGTAKAIQLKAVFGLARRFVEEKPSISQKIERPEQAFEIARKEIAHYKQEVLLVLLQDVRGKLICTEKVGMGTLSELLIHPREIFYPAIRHKAHSFILAHNHPSGDPTPSSQDLFVTQTLMTSSRTLGIPLLDHLIITETGYVSLRQQGVFGKERSYEALKKSL